MSRIQKENPVAREKKFDVEKLAAGQNKESDEEGWSVRDEFQEQVVERVREAWPEEGVDVKWWAVHSAFTTTAKDMLGMARHRHPDWFQYSMKELKPPLTSRNQAYSRWLGTGRQEDLTNFRQKRGTAKRAVRRANNIWFQRKAEEIEERSSGGKCVGVH